MSTLTAFTVLALVPVAAVVATVWALRQLGVHPVLAVPVAAGVGAVALHAVDRHLGRRVTR